MGEFDDPQTIAAMVRDRAAKEAPESYLNFSFRLRADAAATVDKALEKVIEDADLKGEPHARNRALELLAADYLGG